MHPSNLSARLLLTAVLLLCGIAMQGQAGIEIQTNFDVRVAKFIDSRQSIPTLADTTGLNAGFVPNYFITTVAATGQRYEKKPVGGWQLLSYASTVDTTVLATRNYVLAQAAVTLQNANDYADANDSYLTGLSITGTTTKTVTATVNGRANVIGTFTDLTYDDTAIQARIDATETDIAGLDTRLTTEENKADQNTVVSSASVIGNNTKTLRIVQPGQPDVTGTFTDLQGTDNQTAAEVSSTGGNVQSDLDALKSRNTIQDDQIANLQAAGIDTVAGAYQYGKDLIHTKENPYVKPGGDTTIMPIADLTILRQKLPPEIDSFLNRSDPAFFPDQLDGIYGMRINFSARSSAVESSAQVAITIGDGNNTSLSGAIFIHEETVRFPRGINTWNPTGFDLTFFTSPQALANGLRIYTYGDDALEIADFQVSFFKFGSGGAKGGGQVESVIAGQNVTVDSSDPAYPIVAVPTIPATSVTTTDGNAQTDINGLKSRLTAEENKVDRVLTEAEVDAFVANNGYLTAEQDGSTTNELITAFTTDGDSIRITEAGVTRAIAAPTAAGYNDQALRDSLANHDARITANAAEIARVDAKPDLVDDADNDPTNELYDDTAILQSVADNGAAIATNTDSLTVHRTEINQLKTQGGTGYDDTELRDTAAAQRVDINANAAEIARVDAKPDLVDDADNDPTNELYDDTAVLQSISDNSDSLGVHRDEINDLKLGVGAIDQSVIDSIIAVVQANVTPPPPGMTYVYSIETVEESGTLSSGSYPFSSGNGVSPGVGFSTGFAADLVGINWLGNGNMATGEIELQINGVSTGIATNTTHNATYKYGIGLAPVGPRDLISFRVTAGSSSSANVVSAVIRQTIPTGTDGVVNAVTTSGTGATRSIVLFRTTGGSVTGTINVADNDNDPTNELYDDTAVLQNLADNGAAIDQNTAVLFAHTDSLAVHRGELDQLRTDQYDDTALAARVTTNEGDIAGLDTRLTAEEAKVDNVADADADPTNELQTAAEVTSTDGNVQTDINSLKSRIAAEEGKVDNTGTDDQTAAEVTSTNGTVQADLDTLFARPAVDTTNLSFRIDTVAADNPFTLISEPTELDPYTTYGSDATFLLNGFHNFSAGAFFYGTADPNSEIYEYSFISPTLFEGTVKFQKRILTLPLPTGEPAYNLSLSADGEFIQTPNPSTGTAAPAQHPYLTGDILRLTGSDSLVDLTPYKSSGIFTDNGGNTASTNYAVTLNGTSTFAGGTNLNGVTYLNGNVGTPIGSAMFIKGPQVYHSASSRRSFLYGFEIGKPDGTTLFDYSFVHSNNSLYNAEYANYSFVQGKFNGNLTKRVETSFIQGQNNATHADEVKYSFIQGTSTLRQTNGPLASLTANYSFVQGFEAAQNAVFADSIIYIGAGAGRFNQFRDNIILGAGQTATQNGEIILGNLGKATRLRVRNLKFNTVLAPTAGQVPVWNDTAQEYQPGSVSGGTGGTADGVVTGFSATGTGSSRTVTLARSTGGNVTGTLNVADNDNSSTNEKITAVSVAGQTLTISEGGTNYTATLPSGGTSDGVVTSLSNTKTDNVVTISAPRSQGLGTLTTAINVADNDNSVTNETVTDFSISGNTISLTEAGTTRTLVVPSSGGGTADGVVTNITGPVTNGTQKTYNFLRSESLGDLALTVDVADNDNNSTNELQTITGDNGTYTLSGGGGTFNTGTIYSGKYQTTGALPNTPVDGSKFIDYSVLGIPNGDYVVQLTYVAFGGVTGNEKLYVSGFTLSGFTMQWTGFNASGEYRINFTINRMEGFYPQN